MSAAHRNPSEIANSNPFMPTASPDQFAAEVSAFAFTSRNPFDDIAAEPAAVADAPARFVMTRRGPDLDAAEFELPDATSVEVMILWGDNVLHVAHLTPPRSFHVGEEESKNIKCDYFLPHDKLGAPRAPLVVFDPSEGLSLVVLPNAQGFVEIAGEGRRSLETLVAHGAARPCPELPGAMQVRIGLGAKARVAVGDLVFLVSVGHAARKSAGNGLLDRDWTTSLYVGLSMAVHAGMLAAMATFMPSLGGLNDDEAMSRDQLYLMQQYLTATAEPMQEAREADQTVDQQTADNRSGGSGQRATGAEGSMGNPVSRETNGTYGVRGDKENKDPHIARTAALREASTFGLIGVLNSGLGGDMNAPTAPWGRDDSWGNDPLSARGNMWGDSIRDAYGSNGLGLSGIGEGGGGRGEGIGLDSIGTIGRGAGLGDGQGIGNGHGRFMNGHHPKPPVVRLPGVTTVNGKLPPEVIQRIVRQNFGRFRVCYEGGLRGNPALQGRVAVRFIIGRDGAVSNVSNAGSDLPDPNVVQCVTSAFYGLSFPEPEGGIVSVVYPILFQPGE